MVYRLHHAAWLALLAARYATCQQQEQEPQFDFLDSQAAQVPIVAAENATIANCHRACKGLLGAAHPELLVHHQELPEDLKPGYYNAWQRELTPLCVTRPRTAEAVSLVVQSVMKHQCPFAIKSGGHGIAVGSSAIHEGLLLDLKHLNQIEVSEDNQTVSVGPGNTWGAVYDKLEPLGLLVVGGRVSSVGVGGFTMGGGLSFLTNRYGWGMDNVRNFQVVLPNGTLTDASPTSNPDLYFALRGGNGNFGVVTRFDLQARPHGLHWGGTSPGLMRDIFERKAAVGLPVFTPFDWGFHSAVAILSEWVQWLYFRVGLGSTSHELIQAFVDLGNDENTDPAMHAFIYLSWSPPIKAWAQGTTFHYSEAVEKPVAMAKLAAVRSLYNSGRLARMTEFSNEIEAMSPVNQRQYWRTATFKLDAELISKIWDIVIAGLDPHKVDIPDAVMGPNMHILTKHQIALAEERGNAFGLKSEDGPLFVLGFTVGYNSARDDAVIKKMTDDVIGKAVALGKEMGLHHPFIYPNYASGDQDFFAGYAPESRQRLVEIQQIYDPGRKFAKLQPECLRL